ncbi:unnamed protein product [Durusdinium trenchii]|uniref:Uncharacterized protein n=1 Tax=Durusdinium trenchii TaxID=1381693 RepID=A0ABP0N6K2_9DINO
MSFFDPMDPAVQATQSFILRARSVESCLAEFSSIEVTEADICTARAHASLPVRVFMLSKNLMGTMGDFLLAEQKEGVTLTCIRRPFRAVPARAHVSIQREVCTIGPARTTRRTRQHQRSRSQARRPVGRRRRSACRWEPPAQTCTTATWKAPSCAPAPPRHRLTAIVLPLKLRCIATRAVPRGHGSWTHRRTKRGSCPLRGDHAGMLFTGEAHDSGHDTSSTARGEEFVLKLPANWQHYTRAHEKAQKAQRSSD